MDGKVFKELLRQSGLSFAEISRRMGYDKPQGLQGVFKQANIKTEEIELACKALNVGLSYFYPELCGTTYKSNGEQTSMPEAFISILQKKDEQIDRLLSLLGRHKKHR